MSSNTTCHMKDAPLAPPPLIQNGDIVIQAHHVGWIITGAFTIIASITSFWLVNKHLQWYTNKREQRYIVRILFMVPIYSVVSFASYLFWNQSTPLLLIRDCYESTVLTSFFYLLLMYLSPNPAEQSAIFRKVGLSKDNDREALKRGEPLKKWMFPLSFVKSKPRDGHYFLQIMKWGVLQYCVVRPTTTLAAVILDYIGLYCEDSWSPGWGHVYITVIVSISVSIAMYCLIQVYVPVSSHLARHRPLLKLFAVKAVVFLTFWQATFLSLLSTFGLVKDTQYMTAEDINIGIGAILETFEMTLFAFLHIKAFSYKPYRPSITPDPNEEGDFIEPQRTPRLRSLGHALDFRETFRELWYGCVYIIYRWRGIETDGRARRLAAKEELFAFRDEERKRRRRHGKEKEMFPPGFGPDLDDFDWDKAQTRYGYRRGPGGLNDSIQINVDIDEEVHVEAERQWLGTGDDYVYGLGFARRERSAGLEEQIEMELERRGLPRMKRGKTRCNTTRRTTTGDLLSVDEGDGEAEAHRKQRSWWRGVYDRLSRSNHDNAANEVDVVDDDKPIWRRLSRRISVSPRRLSEKVPEGSPAYGPVPSTELYDDRPPQSAIRSYLSAKGVSRSRSGSGTLNTGSPNALQMTFTPTSVDDVFLSVPPIKRQRGDPMRSGEPHAYPGRPQRTGTCRVKDHLPSAPKPERSDQVLSRIFPHSPELPKLDGDASSISASIALSTDPSSQAHSESHRHHIRLAPPALVVPQGHAPVRMPVLVNENGAEFLGEDRRRRDWSRAARVEKMEWRSVRRQAEPISPTTESPGFTDPRVMTPLETQHAKHSPLSLSPPISSGGPRRNTVRRQKGNVVEARRIPRPQIILPLPLAPASLPPPSISPPSPVRKPPVGPSASASAPEVRVALAPPVKRKAVPQYADINGVSPEIGYARYSLPERDELQALGSHAEVGRGIPPTVDIHQTRLISTSPPGAKDFPPAPIGTDFVITGTPTSDEVVGQLRAPAHLDLPAMSHSHACPSLMLSPVATFSTSPVEYGSPMNVPRAFIPTTRHGVQPNVNLQRRGARAMRRLSAPPDSAAVFTSPPTVSPPIITRGAGAGVRNSAKQPRSFSSPVSLPSSGVMGGANPSLPPAPIGVADNAYPHGRSKGIRRSTHRSPARFNFPRHQLQDQPIAEESSVPSSSRSDRSAAETFTDEGRYAESFTDGNRFTNGTTRNER